jgi:molybdopterin-binding protein
MIIQGAANAFISKFTMNGADPSVVSSSVLNLNLVSGGNAYNIFFGTKAMVT